jgi:RimJ/RimL family protein N-acetyltransferase
MSLEAYGRAMKITIGDLELAQFMPKDTRALYCIRNHISVRQFLTKPDFIPYKAHVEWVRKNLIDERRLWLFMIRLKGKAIGFSMLKPEGEDTAEIGLMFREANTHPVVPVYAAAATLYCAFWVLKFAWLTSYPVPTNERALAINRAFGPEEVESERAGTIKLRMNREMCERNPNFIRVFGRIKNRMAVTLGNDARS